MGKLTINGYAKHEYSYDSMKITIGFNAYETTTTLALEKVMNQCEEFLAILADYGVRTEDITLGENSVETNYDDDENTADALREIIIHTAFDMKFINAIMSLIKDKGYDADIDFDYKITNLEKIHQNLLKEAMLDSKRKATLIAESVGQKVVGIDSVDSTYTSRNTMDLMTCEKYRLMEDKQFAYSNKLKSPVTTESENITVTWLVE